MPMCVCTFLEDYDFSGKKIFPVCTNEGSGMGSSIKDLKRLLGSAEVDAGLSIQGAKASASDGAIKKVPERSAIKIIQKRRGKFLAVFVTRPKMHSDIKLRFCLIPYGIHPKGAFCQFLFDLKYSVNNAEHSRSDMPPRICNS